LLLASSYSEFPNADTITRRLKKLTQLIGKFENKDVDIDFESQEENELQGYLTIFEQNSKNIILGGI